MNAIAISSTPLGLAGFVDRADVGAVEGGRRLGFAQEPGAGRRAGRQILREELQGDRAASAWYLPPDRPRPCRRGPVPRGRGTCRRRAPARPCAELTPIRTGFNPCQPGRTGPASSSRSNNGSSPADTFRARPVRGYEQSRGRIGQSRWESWHFRHFGTEGSKVQILSPRPQVPRIGQLSLGFSFVPGLKWLEVGAGREAEPQPDPDAIRAGFMALAVGRASRGTGCEPLRPLGETQAGRVVFSDGRTSA